MIRYLFLALLLLHAIIHFKGFARTLKNDNSAGFVKPVPGNQGWLWLLAAILFVLAGILLITNEKSWMISAFAGLLLSQLLIVINWRDTKWGSIVNIITLLAVLVRITGLYSI